MIKSFFIFAVVTLVATAFIATSSADDFNISNIPIDQKVIWCQAQTSSCTNLCQDSGNNVDNTRNMCDPDTLNYQCFCMNGFAPNSSQYTQTIPYFICTGQETACRTSCPAGNNDCTNGCARNCSASNPKQYNVTAPSSTFGVSATGSHSATPTGNILSSDAINNIPVAAINGCFVVFLTAVLVMFSKLN